MRTSEYLQAAHAFATAGIEPDAWPAALRRLESATGCKAGQLIGIGPSGLVFDIVDLPADRFAQFAEIEGHSPLVNPRVAAAARASPMQVVGDVEYDEVIPLLRTDTYMDWVSQFDIPHGCQATLVQRPDLLVGLCVHRSARAGRIGPDSTAAFAALAPHALAAVQTRLALGERGVRSMVSALEHADVAAFFCDADGAVQAMTGRGERLVAGAGPLALRERRLVAAHASDGPLLLRAFAAATQEPGVADRVVMGPEGRRAAVHIRALGRGDDWGFLFQPRFLVIVKEGPGRPSAELLRLAFGFTAAEAEIALALAAGKPRQRVALQRGVSLGTLRQQVKSIFAKAGVSREADLILAIQALG